MNHELTLATSPEYSAWVAASAGTGKTRLLTNRIINLLLSNIDPGSILCLTFTKAAKGEMVLRINSVLKSFETQTTQEIKEYFIDNLGKELKNTEINKIRNFYKSYISQGKRVQIYTIHAFCQNLLQKFPLEAGVKPYFNVIDEVKRSKYISKILFSSTTLPFINQILQNNCSMSTIKEAIEELSEFYHHLNLEESALSKMHKSLSQFLGVLAPEDVESIEDRLINIISTNISIINQFPELSPLASLFCYRNQHHNSIKKEGIFHPSVISFFTTKDHKKRKKLISKQHAKMLLSTTEDIILQIQDMVFEIYNYRNTIDGISANHELLRLSSFVFSEYNRYKSDNNYLDYEDLIYYSHNLLCNSAIKEWIKYKLDGGIDHILVDESQDTSQKQWSIIIALLEDFFSGHSSSDSSSKTIFVVGDIKQSIYSFQGARPHLFNEAKDYVRKRALGANANFIECNLQKTYRLPNLIFDFIYQTFQNTQLIEEVNQLESNRMDNGASVAIWPLIEDHKNNPEFWPRPGIYSEHYSAKQILAKKIAQYIKNTLEQKLYLDSHNRIVQPSDFLILVQKRSSLNNALYREIVKLGINIAGLDRINLGKSLIVKDFISCIKFIIDPSDNLNLASLLKSPFIGLRDSDLYQIRLSSSWINFIKDHMTEVYTMLQKINNLYAHYKKNEFCFHLAEQFGIQQKLREASDLEQIDALKAFLTEVHMIFSENPSMGMNDIVHFFNTSDISIKRDFSQSEAIKITTIHGAKGLEAPIIILADSNDINTNNSSNILHLTLDQGEIVPIIHSKLKHQKIENIKEQINQEHYQEYLRLLYVALTRAQDHIIITGISTKKQEGNNKSWYEICAATAEKSFTKLDDGNLVLYNLAKKQSTLKDQETKELCNNRSNNTQEEEGTLDYEASQQNYLNSDDITFNAQNIAEYDFDNKSTIIGEKFHKAIEIFFNKNIDFTEILTDKYLKNLSNTDKSHIRNVLDRCSQNQFFHYLKSLRNQSELEIAIGSADGFQIKRLDFVAFDDIAGQIYIVDYKSDKTRVQKNEYINQMNLYKNAMQEIYKDKVIILYLYWLRDNEFERL